MAALMSLLWIGCGPPPTVSERDDGLASLGVREGVIMDLEMDTLSYMSCDAPQSSDPGAYYTFRLGAYRSGGVSLPEDFVARMKELERDQGDLYEVIRRSPVMAGSRPVLSLRETENLQSVVTGSVQPFFIPLDNSTLLTAVIQKPGVKFQHIPQGRKAPARWEASHNVATTASGVQNQDQIRSKLNNYQMMLTVTLGEELGAKYNYARSPADFTGGEGYDKRVYGTGYQLGFVNNRELASVTVRDLETLERKPGKSWSCPADFRFRIPKVEDARFCAPRADTASELGNARRASVRQVLKHSDWDLNWDGAQQPNLNSNGAKLGRCAVPKKLLAEDPCYSQGEESYHYVSFCFAD